MNIKKHIPNTITCGNLVCGCLAIVQIFNGNLVLAAYLVGLAAVLDFFDGFAARLLKVSSPIGKDLDSLADMVTFGVVPGFVMYKLIHMGALQTYVQEHPGSDNGMSFFETLSFSTPLSYFALLIPVFSALRLAKFNNDTRQSDSFIGVPTPANAILICSLPLLLNIKSGFAETTLYAGLVPYLLNTKLLVVLSIVMSVLLVAELPLIALKFKNFGWKGNEIRFVFLSLAVVLLAVFQLAGIPLVIITYLIVSVVNNLIKR